MRKFHSTKMCIPEPQIEDYQFRKAIQTVSSFKIGVAGTELQYITGGSVNRYKKTKNMADLTGCHSSS